GQGRRLQRASLGHGEGLLPQRRRSHGAGVCHARDPGRRAALQERAVARAAHADLSGGPRGLGEICQRQDRQRRRAPDPDRTLGAAKGPWFHARQAAGLHASVMPWLKQRDVALLASDAVNDVQPSGIVGGSGEAANRPVHLISIAVMGMPLVDNGYFENAAKEAAARKRWEFFMTLQLTDLEGGTATNFNALGIF